MPTSVSFYNFGDSSFTDSGFCWIRVDKLKVCKKSGLPENILCQYCDPPMWTRDIVVLSDKKAARGRRRRPRAAFLSERTTISRFHMGGSQYCHCFDLSPCDHEFCSISISFSHDLSSFKTQWQLVSFSFCHCWYLGVTAMSYYKSIVDLVERFGANKNEINHADLI